MTILFLFSILAGLATALSPCILPILPIVLASSASRGKLYPLGVVLGILVSFALATLFLAQLIQSLGVSDRYLRVIAGIVLLVMASMMLIPRAQLLWERVSSHLPQPCGLSSRDGFWGGILVGSTLGLVWAPCAGPILASISTLVITHGVDLMVLYLLFGFAIGIAIPLLGIAYGGALALNSIPFLKRSTTKVRTLFGVITAVTALLIMFNLHNSAAAQLGEFLPQSPLEGIERSDSVKKLLKDLRQTKTASAQGVKFYAFTFAG